MPHRTRWFGLFVRGKDTKSNGSSRHRKHFMTLLLLQLSNLPIPLYYFGICVLWILFLKVFRFLFKKFNWAAKCTHKIDNIDIGMQCHGWTVPWYCVASVGSESNEWDRVFIAAEIPQRKHCSGCIVRGHCSIRRQSICVVLLESGGSDLMNVKALFTRESLQAHMCNVWSGRKIPCLSRMNSIFATVLPYEVRP